MNSILAALGAVAIALVLGTLAAMAVQRYSFFGRESISFLLVLPIALPGVITGIALSTTFQTVGVDFGLMTIIVGHATFCVVIAYNNVIARLRRLPRSPEEASADLGADTWITFRRITLPGDADGAAVRAGCSPSRCRFDEVIVTLFTAGAGTQTIPLWVLAAMQRPTRAAGGQRRRARPRSCSPSSRSTSPSASAATPEVGVGSDPIGAMRVACASRGTLAPRPATERWISRGVQQS